MGNKPHKIKHLQNKALRKFTQIDESASAAVKKTHEMKSSIKNVNTKNAEIMVKDFKKTNEHKHLKQKPHHHKRTTPGSVDAENPKVITGHEIKDKDLKKSNKASTQKEEALKRTFLHHKTKKAA